MLTVPPTRRRRLAERVYRNQLTPADVTTLDAIPVTTPSRTLLDVITVVSGATVEEALDDVLRRGLVSLPRLRWDLARWEGSRLAGVTVLRELIEGRDGTGVVPRSVMETRLLGVIKRAGLPAPVRQHQVNTEDGPLFLDFAYPDAMLGIEADSYRWHSGRVKWEYDRDRLDRLTLLGWRIIHVTWGDLTKRPQAVTEKISRALG